MKKYIWTIACIMILAVTLSGCSNKAFPTGTYTNSLGNTKEYRDDGTFTLWYGGSVVTIGTYSIENNEITFQDTYCDEQNSGSATYAWTYEDGKLSFEVIGEDLCDGRRDTTSVPWFGPE
jgi:major membrane immunogen (membrane-anchored lipoprotein)